jgi:hypothetical protein
MVGNFELPKNPQWCQPSRAARNSRSAFRVKAPVTRRPPHRPGLEDFPHPVPRFRFFYQTINHSGDTPNGVRLCYPYRFKYYGLSSAGVTDTSFEDPQRALFLCGSFGSASVAKLSLCIQILPPRPYSCLSHHNTGRSL